MFWEGNASVHWNQAASQMALANHLSLSDSNRLLAVLNIAMADSAFTVWGGKRIYGADPSVVTWRPVTSIPLADAVGNPDTAPDPDWLPLINTPSHPEYPAGQPNRTYASISQARSDGNNARVWGGMHYPRTVAISDAVGESVADYVKLNFMRRNARAGVVR